MKVNLKERKQNFLLFPQSYLVISSIIIAKPQLWKISFMTYPQTLNFINSICYLKIQSHRAFPSFPPHPQPPRASRKVRKECHIYQQMRKWRARENTGSILLPQSNTLEPTLYANASAEASPSYSKGDITQRINQKWLAMLTAVQQWLSNVGMHWITWRA